MKYLLEVYASSNILKMVKSLMMSLSGISTSHIGTHVQVGENRYTPTSQPSFLHYQRSRVSNTLSYYNVDSSARTCESYQQLLRYFSQI